MQTLVVFAMHIAPPDRGSDQTWLMAAHADANICSALDRCGCQIKGATITLDTIIGCQGPELICITIVAGIDGESVVGCARDQCHTFAWVV